jgi:serine/threonine-protein kinase
VLTVIDFGCTAQGVLYLVTELLRGDALSERLEEGPLTPAVTIELLREVCGALVEAHDLGIVHRDLKPANLFLHQTRHNRVTKVLDFGVAKLVEEPGLTASGQLIGSPAYMSPEQCSGRSLDARSDLYSLGIVAYECLAGRPPFEAPTFVSLVAMQLTEAPAALPTRAAGHDVPTRLATLVEAMLAKRPDDRPASARAVLEALDEIVVDRSSGAASARALAMALDVTTDGGEP